MHVHPAATSSGTQTHGAQGALQDPRLAGGASQVQSCNQPQYVADSKTFKVFKDLEIFKSDNAPTGKRLSHG